MQNRNIINNCWLPNCQLPICHFYKVTKLSLPNLSLPNCHVTICRYQIVTFIRLPNCRYQIVVTKFVVTKFVVTKLSLPKIRPSMCTYHRLRRNLIVHTGVHESVSPDCVFPLPSCNVVGEVWGGCCSVWLGLWRVPVWEP